MFYFIIILWSNDKNNPLAQPTWAKIKPALLPVGLILLFCMVSFFGFAMVSFFVATFLLSLFWIAVAVVSCYWVSEFLIASKMVLKRLFFATAKPARKKAKSRVAKVSQMDMES